MKSGSHTSHPAAASRASLLVALRLGWFLAVRDIRRANIWTNILIIFVMTLTFLNLVVVSGILVGLIEGSTEAARERYTSDIIISTLPRKTYIDRSSEVLQILNSFSEVDHVVTRYIESGLLEANYRNKNRPDDLVDSIGTVVVGIDPVAEDRLTHLSEYLAEGRFLAADDTDEIVVGANLLYKYTPIDSPGAMTIKNVESGSKIRLVLNGITREVTIVGVVKTKSGEVDQRIYMNANTLRKIINRTDYNVDEIAVQLKPGASVSAVVVGLQASGVDHIAKVQTAEQALPKFLNDIKTTFALLGNVVGSIGLVVASITIFIVIFVNAITRRKFIGILKGIGIASSTIRFSYVIQAAFYALVGTTIGLIVLYGFLQPYFAANPINFPFSDGILVATYSGTAIRVLVLFIATTIAGFIPASIVVKQNTLDAILGR